MADPARSFRDAILAARIADRYREAAAAWIEGLPPKVGVLSQFMKGDDRVTYLSPGPMRSSGNFAYVLIRGADKLLHLPTPQEIGKLERGMQETSKGIGDGTIVWWTPAAHAYHFGIRLVAAGPDQVKATYIGRPNNAVGYSLFFGSKILPVSEVSELLKRFSTTGAIRAVLKKWDGKQPAYMKG